MSKPMAAVKATQYKSTSKSSVSNKSSRNAKSDPQCEPSVAKVSPIVQQHKNKCNNEKQKENNGDSSGSSEVDVNATVKPMEMINVDSLVYLKNASCAPRLTNRTNGYSSDCGFLECQHIGNERVTRRGSVPSPHKCGDEHRSCRMRCRRQSDATVETSHRYEDRDFYRDRDSRDDSSSLSSEPSATTTTSSSMSSSTCGEMLTFASPSTTKKSNKSNENQSPSVVSTAKSSPRKTNVQKADSSIQTDASALSNNASASLSTWKKYLHEQHLAIKDNQDGTIQLISNKIGAAVANGKIQSSESIRLRLTHNKSSGNNSGYSNGKAVAVIRGTAATTGRISNSKCTPNRMQQSKPAYSASEAMYSDSEYIQQRQSSSPYYHSKYSYLTSPVRLRNLNTTRMSSYTDTGEHNSRDLAAYGQVLSPWLQRNGFPMQRNAMTEAESMESLSSNLTRRPSSVNKANVDMSGLSTRYNVQSTPTRNKFSRLNMSANSAPTNSDLRKTLEKESDVYASALSLASNSTIFSTAEDKHTQEIRKLRRELEQSNEKVATLTSQLKTSAHMASAFEQSLSAMTARLQQLSTIADQKDAELNRLRCIVEELQRQRGRRDGNDSMENTPTKKSSKDDKKTKKSLVIRRHTFASASEELRPIPKHRSIESLSSGSEKETTVSKHRKKPSRKTTVDTVDGEPITFPASKGWFRNSITKAFRKSKSTGKCRGSMSDAEILNNSLNSGHEGDSSSVPNSPVMAMKVKKEVRSGEERKESSEVVEDLKRQLKEKEKILIDLRLDSLTSAYQLESFKEMINKLRNEMLVLKQDNDRLSRMLVTKSLQSSKSSLLSTALSPSNDNGAQIQEQSSHEASKLVNS